MNDATDALFSGSRDRTVRKWDIKAGELLLTMEGHYDGVTCLLSVEAALLSGSADATVRQWDPDTGELLGTLEGRYMGVTCMVVTLGALFCGSARGAPQRLPPPRRFHAGDQQVQAHAIQNDCQDG